MTASRYSRSAIRRYGFSICACVFLLLWLVNAPLAHADDPPQIASFKSFISAPFNLEDIQFELRRNLHFPSPGKEEFKIRRYSACYQGSNSFLLEPVAEFSDATQAASARVTTWPERIILGSLDDMAWSLDGSGLLTEFRDVPFSAVAAQRGEFFGMKAVYRDFCTIMNLGFTELGIGAISWGPQNTFMVTNHQGMLLRGRLVVSDGLVVEAHQTHLTKQGQTYSYSIKYSYEKDAMPLGFLPSLVRRYYDDPSGSVLDREMRLRKIVASATSIPNSRFQYNSRFGPISDRIQVRNGKLFGRDGSPIRTEMGLKVMREHKWLRLLSFIGALTLSTVLIGIRWRKTKIQPQ